MRCAVATLPNGSEVPQTISTGWVIRRRSASVRRNRGTAPRSRFMTCMRLTVDTS